MGHIFLGKQSFCFHTWVCKRGGQQFRMSDKNTTNASSHKNFSLHARLQAEELKESTAQRGLPSLPLFLCQHCSSNRNASFPTYIIHFIPILMSHITYYTTLLFTSTVIQRTNACFVDPLGSIVWCDGDKLFVCSFTLSCKED